MLGGAQNALIGSPGTILLAFGAVLGRAATRERAQDRAPGTAEHPGCPVLGHPVRGEAAGAESRSVLGLAVGRTRGRRRGWRGRGRAARVYEDLVSELGHRAGLRVIWLVGVRPLPRRRGVHDDVGERHGRGRSTAGARGRRSVVGSRRAVACGTPACPGGVGAADASRVGAANRSRTIRGAGRECCWLGVRLPPGAMRVSASRVAYAGRAVRVRSGSARLGVAGRRRRTCVAVREWGAVSSATHLVRGLIGSSCSRGASSVGAPAGSAAARPRGSSVARDCLGGRD